jgi:hypothetical protein
VPTLLVFGDRDFSPLPDVVEMFELLANAQLAVGGGTTAVACWRTGRRFTGGDLNPHALRFSAARLLSEHAWPDDRQPTLPGAMGQPGPARLVTSVHAALQLDLFGGA